MVENMCARCGQPEFSHPVSPELQCAKYVDEAGHARAMGVRFPMGDAGKKASAFAVKKLTGRKPKKQATGLCRKVRQT